jgi:ABC-2 type transport system permease protein
MNTLPILIRREFWEHRVLWMAPLALALLYIIACLIPGGIHAGGIPANGAMPNVGTERAVMIFLGVQMAFTTFLYMLMSVVVFFYLADCLYAERKDRSILFWKSLPVADSVTVLSKLLVALIAMPLAMWALALVANLLAFGILYVRFHDSRVLQNFVHWDTWAWLRLNGYLMLDVLVIALWYAPVAAWQLLISAWARSAVLVWTLLPPLALLLAERMVFGTWHIARFIAYRLGGGLYEGRPRPDFEVGPGTRGSVEDFLHGVDLSPVLGNVNLWIGLAVAVILVFGAVRIRRYRDDS